MLHLRFLLTFVVALLPFWDCKGQGVDAYIQHTVDSLDKIQPVVFMKVKPQGRTFTIKVKSQQEFDGLNRAIARAIDAGKTNIRVRIGKGTYHFHEDHIVLNNIHHNMIITIVGKNTVLTSYVDPNDADIDPWSRMVQMGGIIQVLDKEKKLCMIPYPNSWNDETKLAMTRVQVTQWFRAPIYYVEKINEHGIYFVANELAWDDDYRNKGYNVNYDYLYLGKNPRFRLYDKRKTVAAKASCFLRMENTEEMALEISGITFKGNKSGQPLIAMNNVNSREVYIHDCQFEHIHDNVGSFSNVNNVTIDKNAIKNTDGHELRFVKNCKNVRVTSNMFENCGQAISNTFCVTCWEGSYYIAYNTFHDFGYAAIGVGVWHGFTKEFPSEGIIEQNEICFTPTYFWESWDKTLMDSGAIYTWTQNDGVIIRYNYIHDYSGAGDNRGIFCDDGACNLKIYGNVVLNTPSSYCIDSRQSKDQHVCFRNNANNFVAYNVVDGRIRFQGYGEEERHCVKGPNYVVGNDKIKDNIFEGLEICQEDITGFQNLNETPVFKKIKIRNR